MGTELIPIISNDIKKIKTSIGNIPKQKVLSSQPPLLTSIVSASLGLSYTACSIIGAGTIDLFSFYGFLATDVLIITIDDVATTWQGNTILAKSTGILDLYANALSGSGGEQWVAQIGLSDTATTTNHNRYHRPVTINFSQNFKVVAKGTDGAMRTYVRYSLYKDIE